MKKILILLTLSLILSSCGTDKTTEDLQEFKPKVEVLHISKNSLKEFNVQSKVTAQNSSILTSEVRANIKTIFVKPGDKVKKGHILINLTSRTIDSLLLTSSSSLNNTQQLLQQTKILNDKNIQSAKLSLEQAELSLKNLLETNKTKLTQAEESLNSTKLNFGLSKESAETSLNTAEKTLTNTINSAKTSADSAISTIDSILGISNIYKNNNDTYENNLGALNTQTKTLAEQTLTTLLKEQKTIIYQYNSMLDFISNTENAIQKTLDMLNNTSTGSNLTQTTLDTYISTVTGNLSSIKTMKSSLISANSSVESFQKALAQTTQSVGETSQTIINAEVQYNSIITQIKTSESESTKRVELSKTAYESTLQSANLSKINASSSVTSAQGSYSQARINQEKLIITAPFDGYIIDTFIENGEEINIGTQLIKIENNDIFKIISYLTPNQINQISIGNEVVIGKKSTDKISAISNSIDFKTGKYKVEITHKNEFLYSGQIINVKFKINNNSISNGIYIPIIAVHITATENFIWCVEDDRSVKKIVELGEITGNNIQILSGLEEKDILIVKGGRMFEEEGIELIIKN